MTFSPYSLEDEDGCRSSTWRFNGATVRIIEKSNDSITTIMSKISNAIKLIGSVDAKGYLNNLNVLTYPLMEDLFKLFDITEAKYILSRANEC